MPIVCRSCKIHCYVGAVDRWELVEDHFHAPARTPSPEPVDEFADYDTPPWNFFEKRGTTLICHLIHRIAYDPYITRVIQHQDPDRVNLILNYFVRRRPHPVNDLELELIDARKYKKICNFLFFIIGIFIAYIISWFVYNKAYAGEKEKKIVV